MATAAGDLVIRLGAQTRGFSRGAADVQRGLRGIVDRATSAASKLTGLFGTLTGIGGAAGLGLMIKRQFAAIDATAKLSDQLGVTTERLQGLRHAAELTGAGANTLDAGLATMAKRLGEAARGSGAAKPALDELGLSAQALIAMSPDKAFYRIAGALEKIEDPARRNAIAANLFSKANMKLLNTLALGEQGLADMQREAEQLGIAFNRVDAAKIEAANDAITRLKQAAGGLAAEAAIGLAPWIEKLAAMRDEIFSMLSVIGKGATALVAFKAGAAIAAGAVWLVTTALKAYRTAQAGATAAAAFFQAIALGPAGWAKLAGGVAAATAAIVAMDAALSKIEASTTSTAQSTTQAATATAGLASQAPAVQGLADATSNLADAVERLGAGMQLQRSLEDIITSAQSGAAALGKIVDEVQKFSLQLQRSLEDIITSAQSGAAALGKIVDEVQKFSLPIAPEFPLFDVKRLEATMGKQPPQLNALLANIQELSKASPQLAAMVEQSAGRITTAWKELGTALHDDPAKAVRDYMAVIEQETSRLRNLKDAVAGVETEFGSWGAGMRWAESALTALQTPLDKYMQTQQRLNSLVEAGAIHWTEANQILADAKKKYEASLPPATAQEAFNSRVQQLKDRIYELSRGASDAEMELRRFSRQPGVTQEQIRRYAELLRKVEELEYHQRRAEMTTGGREPIDTSQPSTRLAGAVEKDTPEGWHAIMQDIAQRDRPQGEGNVAKNTSALKKLAEQHLKVLQRLREIWENPDEVDI